MQFACNLNIIEEVKNFNQLAQKCKGDVTLSSGHWVIDGKSILGLFTLDLSKPVAVEVDNQDDALFLA
jgi:phosphotransferase system HPr-like phosphotransfer protein